MNSQSETDKILKVSHLLLSIIGIVIMASVAFGVLQAQVTANKEMIEKNEILFRQYVKEQNASIYQHIDDKFEGLEKYLDSEFASIKQQVGKKGN